MPPAWQCEDTQLDEAITELREAIQDQPETVFLHTELARLLMRRGDVPAALQACQKALRLDPQYQPAYLVLGQLHANLQHKEEAQAAFRKAIELEPLDEEGYIYLGILHLAAGQQADAIAAFQECCRSSRRRSVASMNWGVCMPKRATMGKLKTCWNVP
jgi:cytochrome c-type biogenesis protein CcmH/NrfG